MISKIIKGIRGLLSRNQPAIPRIVPRAQHTISRKAISANALKVLYRLHTKGYEAYLVGGGIRDILLGLYPKDFDVATNATPEQVRALFRNCRLVGRRFRLAHVFFGPETIEVATFRRTIEGNAHETGLILRDNEYGTLVEDAFRRDFTINALYYNIHDFSLVDYHQAIEDIQTRTLRIIGDPVLRYTEDPVRMLRAIRLAAKCGLVLEKKTAQAINLVSDKIHQVSPARLYEEIQKLFLTGYGVSVFELFLKFKLFSELFPEIIENFHHFPASKTFFENVLSNTDKRVSQKKPVVSAFLFGCLFWGPFSERLARLSKQALPTYAVFMTALEEVINAQIKTVQIPRKIILSIQEMYGCYYRLLALRKSQIFRLITHPKFRSALDFLELVATVDRRKLEKFNWWQSFLSASEYEQSILLAKLDNKRGKNRAKKLKNPPGVQS